MPNVSREDERSRESLRQGSLLSNTNRLEAPFVRVEIEGYSFGVYEKSSRTTKPIDLFPNYVKSLKVKKTNGTVNQYTLDIEYPITEHDDPNFFDKLLSRASSKRKIKFVYGDATLPNYIYKDEEAIITNVTNRFNIQSSVISYTIEAVSASTLTLSGSYRFPAPAGKVKPSDIIKNLIVSEKWHLKDVFTGFNGMSKNDLSAYIMSDDKQVKLNTCTNISVLEYISYLVSCMTPNGSSSDSAIKSSVYSLTTYDGIGANGPYFKVQKIQKSSSALNQLCTYDIDIGYMSANLVSSFNIVNNENWSIYYNYNKDTSSSEYLTRINNYGKEERIYSPQLTNQAWGMTDSDVNWWTQVTQYPIQANITIKGLLRPVVLMQYVKLNVWFYGHKHISSGYYIIKSQTDSISDRGYFTDLELIRVAEDNDIQ